MSLVKSSAPKAKAITRCDAIAMSRASTNALAVSTQADILIEPCSTPAAGSIALSIRSTSRMFQVDSTLPTLMPYKSGETTTSSSDRVNPVSKEFTRTMTR